MPPEQTTETTQTTDTTSPLYEAPKIETTEVKTEEVKAEETKTEETKTEEAPAPLELKIPDGIEVDEAAMSSFKEVLVDPALSPNERGQKLVELFFAQQEAAAKASETNWTKIQEDWQNEVKADKDLGGSKLEGTLSTIAKAIDQYGSQEVREALDMTGAGNNPHVIRFIHKLASQLQEGRPVIPGGPPARSATPAERLYGS
jgi:hypothetical protein